MLLRDPGVTYAVHTIVHTYMYTYTHTYVYRLCHRVYTYTCIQRKFITGQNEREESTQKTTVTKSDSTQKTTAFDNGCCLSRVYQKGCVCRL